MPHSAYESAKCNHRLLSVVAEASTIVQALQARAVAVPEILHSPELLPNAPELLPNAPGFYGWWSRRGVLGRIPHIPHPLDEELSLLYVGISPVRETSRQTLRSRVIRSHLNGNVGSSTFRFVLAALLIDALDLRPYLRGKKVALSASENERLSTWQREQLLLTWCAGERPWETEPEVIAQFTPPLNSAGNAAHAFYPVVRAARAEFRRRAHAVPSMSATSREV